MKKAIASLGLGLGAFVAASPVTAGIVVTFTPVAQHVDIGGTALIDVTIAGLGDQILSGFDLNFLYDGNVIGQSFRSIDATSAQQALLIPGNVNDALVWAIDTTSLGNWGVQASATDPDDNLVAAQANAFLLASFAFSADANGVSSFTLAPDPDFERNFLGLNFATLDVTVNGACIAVGTGVCSVPEPDSFGLAGLAMLGLALPALRRRRQPRSPAGRG